MAVSKWSITHENVLAELGLRGFRHSLIFAATTPSVVTGAAQSSASKLVDLLDSE